jgi:hypothetical protein
MTAATAPEPASLDPAVAELARTFIRAAISQGARTPAGTVALARRGLLAASRSPIASPDLRRRAHLGALALHRNRRDALALATVELARERAGGGRR